MTDDELIFENDTIKIIVQRERLDRMPLFNTGWKHVTTRDGEQ